MNPIALVETAGSRRESPYTKSIRRTRPSRTSPSSAEKGIGVLAHEHRERFEPSEGHRCVADGALDAMQDDTGHWIYAQGSDGRHALVCRISTRCAPLRSRIERPSRPIESCSTRRDGAVDTRTEIVVVASEQAEIRRVTLVNRSDVTRELELTSYGEVVLCPPAADRAHPAFQKLFVQTEWVPVPALLASRRPRSADEVWPWCVHVGRVGPRARWRRELRNGIVRASSGAVVPFMSRAPSTLAFHCLEVWVRFSIRLSRCAFALASNRVAQQPWRLPLRWRQRAKRRCSSPIAIATAAPAIGP